jgi:hypothetical protein
VTLYSHAMARLEVRQAVHKLLRATDDDTPDYADMSEHDREELNDIASAVVDTVIAVTRLVKHELER